MQSSLTFRLGFVILLQGVLVTAEFSGNSEESGAVFLFNGAPSKLSLYVVKNYMKDLVEFQNCTTDEEYLNRTVELMEWRAPDFILNNYPFYLSGFSEENNPVWLGLGGKFDLVALMKRGPEMVAAAEKTIVQAILLGVRSIEMGRDRGGNNNDIPRAIIIIDFDELRLSNIDSLDVIEWIIKLGLRYRLLADFLLEEAYLINVNFAVENLVQLVKPIVGHLLERVQIFGSVKSKWLPVLAQRFPEETLPFRYGGARKHKHLFTYG